MDAARWDDTLQWMIERHGMPEPEVEERQLIVDYLATHFPPRREQQRRGWQNPFQK